MTKNKFFLILLLFCFEIHTQGQLQYDFEHLSTSDGLSNGNVSAMVKDQKGFMWFSTWDGLNRYDGRTFKVYKHFDKNGVATSNRILSIDEDQRGNIWEYTSDGKVFRFDTRLDKFEAIPGEEFDSLYAIIKNTAFLSSGDIWLIAESGIAFRIVTDSIDNSLQVEKFQFFDANQTPIDLNIISEDKNGQIWICTSSGLKLFKRKQDENKIIPIELPVNLKTLVDTSNVKQFKELQNRFYFGTTSGRVVCYDNNTQEAREVNLNNNYPITCLSGKENGVLYIGTAGNGFFEYIPWKNNVSAHYWSEKTKHIFKLYIDRKGMIWIESLHPGISLLDLQTKNIKNFTQSIDVPLDIRDASQIGIIEDDDYLWFTYKGGGFGYYDYKTGQLNYFFNEPGSPSRKFSNFVNCFYKDSDDVLWLSTYFKGIEKISFRKKNYTFLQPAPQSKFSVSNEVRALLLDSKNQLWVATKNAELYILDSDFNQIDRLTHLNGEPIGRIYAMMQDRDGNIFLGTKGNGLFIIPENDLSNYKAIHYRAQKDDSNSISNDNIYAIIQDSDDKIWITTYGGGVNIYENGLFSKPYTNRALQGLKIRCVVEDKRGNIWMGSTKGVYLFNKKKKKILSAGQFLSNSNTKYKSLLENDIFWIYSDEDNNIWIASLGGGLTKLNYSNIGKSDKLAHIEHISKESGLPSDVVFTIIGGNDGNLWMSTDNGISNYNYKKKTFNNYAYLSTPSVFSEGSIVKTVGESIIFGANNGIYIFHPGQLNNSKEKTPLVFSDFLLFGNSIKPEKDGIINTDIDNVKKINLKHHQNAFTVRWAGLAYNRITDLKYLYKLEGYDNNWRIAQDQNLASYAKVPPGEYVFKVKMLSSDFSIPETLRSFDILVKPSFWLSYQLIIIYFVLLVLIGVFLRRTTLTIIKLRNKIVVEKELSNMKLEFFTNISHELRTPLTLILGPAKEIKRSEPLTKKGNLYINLIEENTQRLLKLVNHLLDFRKIQSKKMELNLTLICVNDLISEICRSFDKLASDKGIKFEKTLHQQDYKLKIDKEKISSVLINLLSNAFKFTPRGGTVKVISNLLVAEKKYEIQVLDSGPGITSENADKIFQPFVSFHNSGKNTPKGTGIGLALSKEFIELHDGEIMCIPLQSEGAAFVVKLPCCDKCQEITNSGEEEILSDDVATERAKPKLTSSLDKESLLIVEDNEELRRFLILNLSENYIFYEAKDGKEGIKLAREHNPDIILSDIMMPVMDGIKMMDILKNNEDTSHIPIVLLSAKTSIESKIEGLRYGADAYLTKPFNTEQLQAQLRNLIRQRSLLRNAYLSLTEKEDIKDIQITSTDDAFLQKVKQTIEDNLTNSTFRVDDLYAATNMGRSKFSYKLKGLTGLSPIDFVKEFRLTKAIQLLKSGQYNVSEVSYLSGYTDAGYFSKSFKERFGKNPSDLLKK